MYLYKISNSVSESIYIGITKNKINDRWSSHKNAAKRGVKTPLYDSMRAKGFECFQIEIVQEFSKYEDLLKAEYNLIKKLKDQSFKLYNLLDGGISHFNIKDKEAWKQKLKKARAGRKPFLGMKHTEDNKQLFKEVSNKYWSTQKTYSHEDIKNLSLTDAIKTTGISKTHYYRLKNKCKTGEE